MSENTKQDLENDQSAPGQGGDDAPPEQAAKPKHGKVVVVMLAHGQLGKPGDEVEVSEEHAAAMCTVRNRNDGHGLVPYQVAMRKEDWVKLRSAPVDKGGLTQGEMTELGLQNKVQTPADPVFEAHLDALRKRNKEKGDEQAKDVSKSRARVDKKKAALKDKGAEAPAQ